MAQGNTGDELRRITEEARQRQQETAQEPVRRREAELAAGVPDLTAELIASCLLLASNAASMGGRSVTMKKEYEWPRGYQLLVGPAVAAAIQQLAVRGITVRSDTACNPGAVTLFISW